MLIHRGSYNLSLLKIPIENSWLYHKVHFECSSGRRIKAAVLSCSANVLFPWLIEICWRLMLSVVFWCRIDHWDMEKERLVLLTTKSILIVNFDFILVAVSGFRRILLNTISRIQIGDLVYPAASLMPYVNFSAWKWWKSYFVLLIS